MTRPTLILDKPWWFLLKESEQPTRTRALLKDVKISELEGKLVICMMVKPSQTADKMKRLYSHFNSYVEFYEYQNKFPPERRSFYEVALGDFPQKPRFDLDLNRVDVKEGHELVSLGEALKDGIIKGIMEVLSNFGVNIQLERDILVYSSHNQDKRSYHIVVNNYCHLGHLEAKAFYQLVVKTLAPEYQPYVESQRIDPAVYSPTQQFRTLGSQKLGSGRVKIFHPTFNYFGQTVVHRYIEEPDTPAYEQILQLEESLLTSTSSCHLLPSILANDTSGQFAAYNKIHYNTEDVSLDLAKRALEMVAKMGGMEIKDPRFPYKILNISGGVVMLKRLKASKCRICQRVHEYENPYLLIMGEESLKRVYFHCRRAAPDKKLLIGDLESGVAPLEEPVSEEAALHFRWAVSVGETLQNIMADSPVTKVKMPITHREGDPTHSRTIMRASAANMKWTA